jgi:hypothetical protein
VVLPVVAAVAEELVVVLPGVAAVVLPEVAEVLVEASEVASAEVPLVVAVLADVEVDVEDSDVRQPPSCLVLSYYGVFGKPGALAGNFCIYC